MNIGELFIALSFNSDLTALTTLNNGMNGAQKMAMGLKNAVLGLSYTLDKLVSSALQSAVNLQTFTYQTGLSIQQLQQWQYIANQSNVSNQNLQGSILGIQQAQANLMMGQGNIRPWAILGISPTEDPFSVIQKLRNAIKGLPAGVAMSLITQMGLSPDMINILKSSSLEFDKLSKKFILTNREQKNLMSLNKAFKDLGFSIKGMAERLVAINYEPIMRFFKAIKNTLSIFFDLTKKISEFIQHSQQMKTILISLVAVFGTLSLLNPFMAWSASILAIILILDDLYVYLHGGKSLIGDLFKAFDKSSLGKSFKNMSNIFKDLKNGFKEFDKIMSKIGLGSKNWKAAGDLLKEGFVFVLQMAADAMDSLVNGFMFFMKLIDTLSTKGIKGLFEDIDFKNSLSKFGDAIKFGLNPLLMTTIKQNAPKNNEKMIENFKKNISVSMPSGNNMINNYYYNTNAPITVNEAKSGKDSSKEIKRQLDKTYTTLKK